MTAMVANGTFQMLIGSNSAFFTDAWYESFDLALFFKFCIDIRIRHQFDFNGIFTTVDRLISSEENDILHYSNN